MSQISQQDLSLDIKSQIYKQLNFVLKNCHDENDVELLLSELLTKTERIILAKRLFIAVLLTKGYSYRDIRIALHVSFPTIRSVQFWLEHGGQGYKKAVKEIIDREENKEIFIIIDGYIDSEAKRGKSNKNIL